MGQAQAIADGGSIFCGAQSNGEIVFTRGRISPYFEGADITHRVAERILRDIAKALVFEFRALLLFLLWFISSSGVIFAQAGGVAEGDRGCETSQHR